MSDDGTTVACPVADCAFRDTASLVAAHVDGTERSDHDWDRLRFGGPRDFLEQARDGWLDESSATVTTDEADASTDGDTDAGGVVDAAPTDAPTGGETASTENDEGRPRLTGDTTLAEVLDLLESAESDAAVPVDPAPVERALVLADLLVALAADHDTRTLVDAYTLASDLASAADDVRIDLRDELLDRTDEGARLRGDLGEVQRATRVKRDLKTDEVVLSRLRDVGIDPDLVVRPDAKRVREILESANFPESLAFDRSESSYVRKLDSDPDATRRRLAALRRRDDG